MGGGSQTDLLTIIQDEAFTAPSNKYYIIMEKSECGTSEILLGETAVTSLGCLVFRIGQGFCGHLLQSSDASLMCPCLGEQGYGREDSQPPCASTELKAEEGQCSSCAFGCFQHWAGSFAGKCWQKVPETFAGGTGRNGEGGGMQGDVQRRRHASESYRPSKG